MIDAKVAPLLRAIATSPAPGTTSAGTPPTCQLAGGFHSVLAAPAQVNAAVIRNFPYYINDRILYVTSGDVRIHETAGRR